MRKNEKMSKTGVFIGFLVILLGFSACSFWVAPETAAKAPSTRAEVLEQKDMLALMHLVKNHVTPVEKLETQVLAILQSDFASGIVDGRSTANEDVYALKQKIIPFIAPK